MPGFGAIVALISLIGAAILAIKKQSTDRKNRKTRNFENSTKRER